MRQHAKCCKRIVVKYGGASLADDALLSKAVADVTGEAEKGTQVAVVVSAIGKTTDLLLSTARNTSNGKVGKGDLDDILAMGERTSIRIFAAALNANGVESRYIDPTDPEWPIMTDDAFSNANPLLDHCKDRIRQFILPLVEHNIVPVIAGFIGKTLDGKISTLGRGGSDTTAFILAEALGADEGVLIINADGIMSASPKIVKNPKRLHEIDVSILAGIADSGTKFIHRKALRYKSPLIDVRVVNRTCDLNSSGTLITGALSTCLDVVLACRSPAMSITVVGHAISKKPEIVLELAKTVKAHVSLLGVSLNYDSVILYLSEKGDCSLLFEEIHEVILKHDETVAMSVREKLAFLEIKGVGLEETPGIVGKISEALRLNDINIFGILTITSSILIFVDWKERETVQKLIRYSLRRNKR